MRRKPIIEIVGDQALQNIDIGQNRAFLCQVQEALLLGLLNQGKLDQGQYDRCARELSCPLSRFDGHKSKRYNGKKKEEKKWK